MTVTGWYATGMIVTGWYAADMTVTGWYDQLIITGQYTT